MSHSSQKLMFTLAAVFNWLVGLALFFDAAWLFDLFYITPVPDETLFLRLFAGIVFVFGFGYYAAGSNLATNAPVIRLGTIGKLVVVAVAAYEVWLGSVSWQFLLVASVDLIFAILFLRELRKLR